MKHEFIMPFICKWEGGLSNDPDDKAAANPCPIPYKGSADWHTNMGIIWPVWVKYCSVKGVKILAIQADRFYKITKADQSDVFKTLYWDSVFGDQYQHQAIANCMASWAWGSGVGGYSKKLKDYTGALKQIRLYCSKHGLQIPTSWDQVPGILNDRLPAVTVFNELCDARKEFFISISPAGSKNAKFRKGWLKRLQAFRKYNESLLQ